MSTVTDELAAQLEDVLHEVVGEVNSEVPPPSDPSDYGAGCIGATLARDPWRHRHPSEYAAEEAWAFFSRSGGETISLKIPAPADGWWKKTRDEWTLRNSDLRSHLASWVRTVLVPALDEAESGQPSGGE